MIEDYSVYRLSMSERIVFSVLLILCSCGLGYIFYLSLLPCIAVLFVYKRAEKLYCGSLAVRRQNRLRMEFRDFLYSLSSSFASGRYMAEAMEEAQESLSEIYGKDSLLYRELGEMLKKMEETGETDICLWEDFARRSRQEDILNFTAVYRACRDSGGNLITAVNQSALIIGEKITIESEIRTMAVQKKFEGRMIALMPAIVILFLQVMSPDYLEVMYTTLAGRILMTVALCATGTACLIIERMTKIEV